MKKHLLIIILFAMVFPAMAQTVDKQDSTKVSSKEKYSFNKHFAISVSPGLSCIIGKTWKGAQNNYLIYPINFTLYYNINRINLFLGWEKELINVEDNIYYPFSRYKDMSSYRNEYHVHFIGLSYYFLNKNSWWIGLRTMVGAGDYGFFTGLGVDCELNLNKNISILFQPSVKKYQPNDMDLSLQAGVKFKFIPFEQNEYTQKDTIRKFNYGIALGMAVNMLPEKYGGSNSYPYYINRDDLIYKNAFGYFFSSFPIIEFNLQNKKKYTHAAMLGYQKSLVHDEWGPTGGKNLTFNDYHVSYELNRPFSKKNMKAANITKYLYGGARVSLNYKRLTFDANSYDWTVGPVTALYNSEFFLGLLQFPIGYKTHLKGKSFYLDMGININLLAYSTGNFNYSYQKQDNVSGKIIKNDYYTDHTSKLLSFPDLWGNLHLFNNLFFKVGYRIQ